MSSRKNIKIQLLLAITAAVATAPLAPATVVTFTGTPDNRSIFDSTGTQLLTNSLVWMGTFASESFTLNPSLSFADNVAAIQSAGMWEQFGVDTVADTTNAGVTSTIKINAAGIAAGKVTDNNFGATKADYFNSKPLYLWVFNASSVGAASEMGIFRAPPTGQAGSFVPWTFPNNDGAGGSVTLATDPVNTAIINVIGGVGTNSGQLRTAGLPIPEPSTLTFGVIGILGALCSRRRPSL